MRRFSTFALMHPEFIAYIKRQANLTDDEVKLVCSKGVERTIPRKQLLLQQGEICRHKVFVSKGCFSTFRTKEDGVKHIIDFSAEDSWIVDPESYNHGTPTAYSIEALEESVIIQWTKNDFNDLFAQIPQIKAYSEKLVSEKLLTIRQRLYSAISSTAEEKYDEFIKTYPAVFARVPLHMVASYLGVSRETLSRIRQAQVRR